jgi:nickel transport protein
MCPVNPYKNIRRLLRATGFLVFIILFITMSVPYALAHKVILSAYVEGDSVFVESGFSDGTFCNNALIEVFDPSGKKLLEGKTDENGGFSFKPAQRTDLTLVINAGMGHRAEYTVPAEELPEIPDVQKTGQEAPSPPAFETKQSKAPETVARMDIKEIESIVDSVVQKRLRPLTQLVAKSQRDTGFSPTEVFGGIGYILGLMGIAMYVRYRKMGRP